MSAPPSESVGEGVLGASPDEDASSTCTSASAGRETSTSQPLRSPSVAAEVVDPGPTTHGFVDVAGLAKPCDVDISG